MSKETSRGAAKEHASNFPFAPSGASWSQPVMRSRYGPAPALSCLTSTTSQQPKPPMSS